MQTRPIPVKYVSGPHGEQAHDIYSWLANHHHTIMINHTIDDDLAAAVNAQLYAMLSEGIGGVKFWIDSGGGSVYSLMSILDSMDAYKAKGKTISVKVNGIAMSAAAVIAANGSKGHREISKRSRFLIHDIRGGNWGHLRDQEAAIEDSKVLRRHIMDTLISNTNITEKELETMMIKDTYISAYDAVSMGLADKVV